MNNTPIPWVESNARRRFNYLSPPLRSFHGTTDGRQQRHTCFLLPATNDGKGQQGDGMTATGGTTKRQDDGVARHDDGDPRSWDGGAIVARRGRSTLSIAVTGGGSLA